MFWLIFSIILAVLSIVLFVIYSYNEFGYLDFSDFMMSSLIGILGVGVGILISFIVGSLFDASILYENDNIPDNKYEILNTYEIKRIINIETSEQFAFEDGSVEENNFAQFMIDKSSCFFIPWNEDKIVLFHLNQSSGMFGLAGYYKAFVYIPEGKYTNTVNSLSSSKEHCLDSTFLNPKDALVKVPVSTIAKNSTIVDIDDTSIFEHSPLDVGDVNTYSDKLIESKPIFKYDIKNGVYTIRYNDGTLLDINSYVVEVKTSNEGQMYIDKLQVTVPDINGSDVSFYRYEIYK